MVKIPPVAEHVVVNNIVLLSRMYQDKLAHLKKQLQHLKEGTLPEYIKRNRRIEQQYRERLRLNEIWRDIEVE